MVIVVLKTELVAKDERGDIVRIVGLDEPLIRSILKISMVPGCPPRGNHWHKHDTHWVYVDKGQMKYSEADPETPQKVEGVIMKAGEYVVSHPGKIHAMQVEGTQEVIFWAITTEPRDQTHYEGDTTGVKIV